MLRSLKKFISSERGDAGIYVLLIFMVMIIVFAAGSIGFVWRFWLIKNQVGHGLHMAMVQAANTAGSYSTQNALSSGSNQLVINQDEAERTFNAVLPLDLGLPSSQYTVDAFVVYGPSDAGKPLPCGYPGVAPGTSLYAHITVKTPIGEAVGLPKLTGVTYYVQVDHLVAANRFIEQQRQWQGG